MRCRAPGGVQGIERLALRVDPDVRVVLQHPARQVAADRFEHVIGHAHLGQLGDDRVPQVVEPEAGQARRVTQRPPGRVPLQHRLGGVVAAPLARRPEVVLGLGVSEQIRALEHPRRRFDGRCVERDDAVARLVLAPPDVHEPLDEIDVAAAKVLHLDRALCDDGRVRIEIEDECGGVPDSTDDPFKTFADRRRSDRTVSASASRSPERQSECTVGKFIFATCLVRAAFLSSRCPVAVEGTPVLDAVV